MGAMMVHTKTVPVVLNNRKYPVIIGNAIVHLLPAHIANFSANRQVAIISTPPVACHYLKKVVSVFPKDWQVIS